MKVVPLLNLEQLRIGMTVRHKRHADARQVIDIRYGADGKVESATVINVMHVRNPAEWLVIENPE